jgi:hypothetical protein
MAMIRGACRVLCCLWLALPACTCYGVVDLRELLERQDFPLTQGEPPPGSETIGFLAARDNGFYLFGILPLMPMSFDDCVGKIVRAAKELGADGIAYIDIHYEPASVMSLTAILLPDWFSYVQLTGSAWRRPRH